MRHHRPFRLLALLLGLSLVLLACGDDGEATDEAASAEDEADGGAGTDGDQAAAADGELKACQVTDAGGIDDQSFNQTAWEGIERAGEELGADTAFLESSGEEDYETNINAFLEQDCTLIVTVGFLLGDATAEAAEANPDQRFAIVDYDFFDTDAGEDVVHENVRELTFATDEAAFLAGYLAAGMTETGTVGTFGGLNIPTVTIFMDGFLAGIQHYNEQNDADVQLLGWDGEDGLFTGDFENQSNGRQTAQSLLDEGADIILPVAGPVGLGAAAAVRDAGDAAVIWVDTDGCESAAEFCDIFLTSVMKNMDVAVYDTVQQVADDTFEGGLYLGTLENDGVAIAPYHEFADEVPEELKADIEDLRQQIIDGDLEVSPS